MKKIFVFALCLASVGSVCAQKKILDQAEKKLGSKTTRELIQQASNDPETKGTDRLYYLAGKNEFKIADEILKPLMINPQANVDQDAAGNALLTGYDYFLKAIPLAKVPDEKGKQRTKYLDDMASMLAGHINDYYTVGANFFNTHKYYPEAYNSFMIFGELPVSDNVGKFKTQLTNIPDSVRATAFHNAGIAAFSAKELDAAANAFHKASEAGLGKKSYIYEISCWQNIAKDSVREAEAEQKIAEIAKQAYEELGIENLIFLQNLVNSYIQSDRQEEGLALVNKELASNPNNAQLYGLLGFVYDRMNNDAESEAAYRKGAALPDADVETLKNAGKKIFRAGTERWNKIEGADEQSNAERAIVKKDYFETAKSILERAKQLNPKDGQVDYILENINYALDSYF